MKKSINPTCPLCKSNEKVVFRGLNTTDLQKIYICRKKIEEHINEKYCYFTEKKAIFDEYKSCHIKYIKCPICSESTSIIMHKSKYNNLKCKSEDKHPDGKVKYFPAKQDTIKSLEDFLKEYKQGTNLTVFKKCYQKYKEKNNHFINIRIDNEDMDILKKYVYMRIPYKIIAKLFSVSKSTITRKVGKLKLDDDNFIQDISIHKSELNSDIFSSLLFYKKI